MNITLNSLWFKFLAKMTTPNRNCRSWKLILENHIQGGKFKHILKLLNFNNLKLVNISTAHCVPWDNQGSIWYISLITERCWDSRIEYLPQQCTSTQIRKTKLPNCIFNINIMVKIVWHKMLWSTSRLSHNFIYVSNHAIWKSWFAWWFILRFLIIQNYSLCPEENGLVNTNTIKEHVKDEVKSTNLGYSYHIESMH